MLFTRYQPHTQGSVLVSMAPDGSDVKRLPRSSNASAAEYSPDGRSILLATLRPARLWTVTSDGARRRKIAEFSSLQVTAGPSWSPDGMRIAFVAQEIGSDTPSGLYVFALASHRLRRVAGGLPTDGGAPSWSPDSRFVLVTRTHGVYRINVRTGRSTRAIDDDSALQPAWSPDGHRIAYLHPDEPCRADVGCTDFLTVVTTTGGPPRQLVSGAQQPVWSPNGAYLLYTKQFGPRLGHLFKLALASRRKNDLTPGTSQRDIGRPTWQPRCGR